MTIRYYARPHFHVLMGRCLAAAAFVMSGMLAGDALARTPTVEELRDLSIEELSNIAVTSVFKRPESVAKTPAAVYVITREDIHRSGAQTLPEVLRLAPNLMVARRNARDYAISARGFNWYQLSNKLLVLIDGRSVYTPLHAGVLWDEQQVMLEDVERIEVISGPAGAVWGANAVNGVINVITRKSHETQGGVAAIEAGTFESRAAVRYGGKIGEQGAWRAYGMGLSVDQTQANGTGRDDDWINRQAGFRTDWNVGRNRFAAHGDLFKNRFEGDGSTSGGNIAGNWTHQLEGDSSLFLQAYYNRAVREQPQLFEKVETVDVEARHNLRIGKNHELVWGGGYRVTEETFDIEGNPFVIEPTKDTITIANVFAQDSIALGSDLTLTLGAKFEHSSYSGGEFLPSARLAWQVAPAHMLWAGVSRTVRTPSRIDRELEGAGVLEEAGEGFGAEELVAYELGYRGRPDDRSTFSVTLYYQSYDDLRVLTTSPSTGLLQFGNAQDGYTMGVETWGEYHVSDRWRVMAGLNLFRKDLDLEPGASTVALVQHQGNDPEYQAFLRSYVDVTKDVTFDLALRMVDSLPSPSIPSYTALDARIAWQVTDRLELSLVGRNLLESSHRESGDAGEFGEIPRSVYIGLRTRF